MNLKIVKLDGRFNGHPDWKYLVEPAHLLPPNYRVQLFVLWREWCWAEWGPSKELDLFYYDAAATMSGNNQHWCWVHDDYKRGIYFRNDVDLTAFTLVWA